MPIFQDPAFWVAIAFVIFVAGAVWKGRAPIAGMLDARIEGIRTEIDEARELREQAQASLAGYQRKLRDAIGEAKEIVAHAGDEADRSAKRATEALAAVLARRQAQALDNIAQAEAAAVKQVRDTTVDVALAATREVLRAHLAGADADALIDAAIQELPEHLH